MQKHIRNVLYCICSQQFCGFEMLCFLYCAAQKVTQSATMFFSVIHLQFDSSSDAVVNCDCIFVATQKKNARRSARMLNRFILQCACS